MIILVQITKILKECSHESIRNANIIKNKYSYRKTFKRWQCGQVVGFCNRPLGLLHLINFLLTMSFRTAKTK
jgi:hypothetical protein